MFTKDDLFLSCLVACCELTVESNILSKIFSQCDIILEPFAQRLQILFCRKNSSFPFPDIIVMWLMTWFHYTHGLLLLYLLQIEALDPPYIRSRFQSFCRSHPWEWIIECLWNLGVNDILSVHLSQCTSICIDAIWWWFSNILNFWWSIGFVTTLENHKSWDLALILRGFRQLYSSQICR